jgi:hypothetical protein
VADAADARVVVDSSKFPWEAAVTALTPGVVTYVVRLNRDPRAVGYSWSRVKHDPDRPQFKGEMQRHTPRETLLMWNVFNTLGGAVARRSGQPWTMVLYEELMRDPRRALASVAEVVGEPAEPMPVAGDRTLTLGPKHLLSGNPDRFSSGTTELRIDDEWRRKIRTADKVKLTAGTLPLLPLYRYPLWPRAAGRADARDG